MPRILLALVGFVLTVAPVPARADSAGERAREVGVIALEGLGEHARTSAPVGAAPAESGASARAGTGPVDSALEPCFEAPTLARSGGRASAITRGFGEAARGDHLPYFPVAPPVLG